MSSCTCQTLPDFCSFSALVFLYSLYNSLYLSPSPTSVIYLLTHPTDQYSSYGFQHLHLQISRSGQHIFLTCNSSRFLCSHLLPLLLRQQPHTPGGALHDHVSRVGHRRGYLSPAVSNTDEASVAQVFPDILVQDIFLNTFLKLIPLCFTSSIWVQYTIFLFFCGENLFWAFHYTAGLVLFPLLLSSLYVHYFLVFA